MLPNVIGEGGLFGFSGMDGETCALSGFLATWAADGCSLLFHTKKRRLLRLRLPAEAETIFATGDACRFRTSAGERGLVYAAWHTLVGYGFDAAEVSLEFEDGTPAERQSPQLWTTRDENGGDYLVLAARDRMFGLGYGKTAQEAAGRAQAGLAADPAGETEQRLRLYETSPLLRDSGHARLLNKCISVMKVNTLSPEGAFGNMWSTPDRVPHKDMWLWDTVFHSLAMNELDAGVSWQCLRTMLDTAGPDGMIAHHMSAAGRRSSITQPPILAWGVWENYAAEPDAAKLRHALPILERYLEWDLRNRDANGNGLLEWKIEGDVNCRSGESGMDNSSRFDEAIPLDAVDFSVFMALDMAYTAKIAAALGLTDKAAAWDARAKKLSAAIVAELWDERDRFFYDKRPDGTFSRVRAVSGFLPLLLDELPPSCVEGLTASLRDPAHFAAAVPVPSLALSEPTWGTDMWRGPTWINLNYLIVQGLRRQGRHAEADALADGTIALVGRYYERYGVVFEYYDSADERHPPACDRKGPVRPDYDIRVKVDSIRDYHWTAALTACLLLEKYGLRKSERTVSGIPAG